MELQFDNRGPPAERYEILGKIATGAMGEIYIARTPSASGRPVEVALKRLKPHLQEDPDFIEMFYDEARIASKLRHPNIIGIYEMGEIDGSLFIAMELVPGVNLSDLLRHLTKVKQVMPLRLVMFMMTELLAGLTYAHNFTDDDGRPLNIVHRDVSPQNVLLSFQGEVKLLDFGVTKAEGQLHKTHPGMVKGKLAYMAPEQVRGDDVDPRTDLFALAAVIYETALFRHPFYGKTDPEVVAAIMRQEPPDPRSINHHFPGPLAEILLLALKKKPEQRFRSAEEFAAVLRDFVRSHHLGASQQVLQSFMEAHFADRLRTLAKARRTGDDGLLVQALSSARVRSASSRPSRARKPAALPSGRERLALPAPRQTQRPEPRLAPAQQDSIMSTLLPQKRSRKTDSDPKVSTPPSQAIESISLLPPPTLTIDLQKEAESLVPAARSPTPDLPGPEAPPAFPIALPAARTIGVHDPSDDLPQLRSVDATPEASPQVAALDRLSIGEEIHAGPRLRVHHAILRGEEGFERDVALMRLSEGELDKSNSVRGFLHAARIAARLNHPCIRQVYDLGTAPDGPFAIVEPVTGRSLEDVLQRCRVRGEAIPPYIASRILVAVSSALSVMHGRRPALLHRRIDPRNIIISPQGHVKLVGFDCARSGAARLDFREFVPNQYASPERWSAGAKAETPASDVFSLGTLMRECVTLRSIFERPTVDATRSAIVAGNWPPLTSRNGTLPDALVALVNESMKPDPGERPQSAKDFMKALDGIIEDLAKRVVPERLADWLDALFS